MKPILLLPSLILLLAPCGATTITLRSESAIWRIEPRSLAITAQPADSASLPITGGLDITTVLQASSSATSATWQWPQWSATVHAETLPGNGLRVAIQATRPQEIRWPVFTMPVENTSLLFPLGEGLRIPVKDSFWQDKLSDHEWDAAESLSMPVVGLTSPAHTLTWFTAQPLRTNLGFLPADSNLDLAVTHSLHPKSPTLLSEDYFYLDSGTSITAPSHHYRQWLVSTGQFKTLDEKAAELPEVNKLLGALHAYLWGGNSISADAIEKPAQWKSLCQQLLKQSDTTGTLAHHLRQYFTAEEWGQVEEGSKQQYVYAYIKNQITAGLAKALESETFRTGISWDKAAHASATAALGGKSAQLSTTESLLFNSHLLAASYPGIFTNPESWGDGVSTRMLDLLDKSGFQHLRLCTDDHLALQRRPWVASHARDLGWLIGTYDSYHSIHPTSAPADLTWSTAQMTDELYENGTIQRADGTYLSGFKKVGRKLNPAAGRAFMEHRVARNMADVPYNYYFIDCDATGESADDYNRLHPGSREGDIAERLRRLQWISKTFRTVIGSEGGNAFSAAAIHASEGIFNPFFGWGDKAMEDASSPYYRCRYYPPEQPDVFFKTAPLQEKYQRTFYDPAVRIPMYGLVFHDSVVATAHWNNAHYKWADTQTTLALTELLYLAPPLVHLTPAEFVKRQKNLKSLYEIWSPLHEKFGFTPMTDFRHLDESGLVQQSEFTPGCRVIANFSPAAFSHEGHTIPAGTALIIAPSVWPEPKAFKP